MFKYARAQLCLALFDGPFCFIFYRICRDFDILAGDIDGLFGMEIGMGYLR